MSNIRHSKMTVEQAALFVCALWADARSKDPSTQVGACIVDPQSGGLFLGYNGLPSGWPDTEEQWNAKDGGAAGTVVGTAGTPIGYTHGSCAVTKYDLVIHAEVNAVRKALIAGVRLPYTTLVCTHIPCPQCFKDVVLANGIKRVAYMHDSWASRTPRDNWVVRELAKQGGVKLIKEGVVQVALDAPDGYFQARNEKLDALLDEDRPEDKRCAVCDAVVRLPYTTAGRVLCRACHGMGGAL